MPPRVVSESARRSARTLVCAGPNAVRREWRDTIKPGRGETLFLGRSRNQPEYPELSEAAARTRDHGNSERTTRGYSSALPWSRESQTDTCRGARHSGSPQPPPRKQPAQAQGFLGRWLGLSSFRGRRQCPEQCQL